MKLKLHNISNCGHCGGCYTGENQPSSISKSGRTYKRKTSTIGGLVTATRCDKGKLQGCAQINRRSSDLQGTTHWKVSQCQPASFELKLFWFKLFLFPLCFAVLCCTSALFLLHCEEICKDAFKLIFLLLVNLNFISHLPEDILV